MEYKVDFDNYQDSYQEEVNKAASLSGKDVGYFTEFKAKLLTMIAKNYLGETGHLKVLDVGCGTGFSDSFLIKEFSQFYGVDVTTGILKKAAETNPSAHYQVYDGINLPFSDYSFDITFAIGVFHHVHPLQRGALMKEMMRVIKKEGLVVIFEHNPLNPMTRLIVFRCEFDKNAVLLRQKEVEKLFSVNGLIPVEKRYFLFTPFTGSLFKCMDQKLWWLPFGAQYYSIARKYNG